MIILEEPYISETLLLFLEESQLPVLNNTVAKRVSRTHTKLNILEEQEFIEHYNSSNEPSLYTVSEYALGWIYDALPQATMLEQVTLLKDKAAFRKACSVVNQELIFQELSYYDLATFDISTVTLPIVLKPSVGFLSAGVYTITNETDWKEAVDDVQENFKARASMFPDKVVKDGKFIIESYIQGREFAIDVYFDEKEPVIINIFEHPFSSEKDVSDRLYNTSKKLFDNYLKPFRDSISRLNEVLNIKNIPVHIELRMDENNKILPIEINPLRFTGLCLNDLHSHISGKHPLSYYFSKTKPDYEAMWRGKEDKTLSFSIFEKPENTQIEDLDLEHLKSKFSKILEYRPVNTEKLDIAAFVFYETNNNNEAERDYMLRLDMNLMKTLV